MGKSDESGLALIVALLVLAFLVAIILGFDAHARRELREAEAFRDGLKAASLAQAGLQLARATLRQDRLLKKRADQPYDAPGDLWAKPISPNAIGDELVTVEIEDERAKVNLNDLAEPPPQPPPGAPEPPPSQPQIEAPKTPEAAKVLEPFSLTPPPAPPTPRPDRADMRADRMLRLKRLFAQLQLDPQLVEPLADWVDEDEAPEPAGAESAYYLTLTPPYRAANAALKTFDELRLIKGFSDEVVQRLSRYATVYAAPGKGAINLNTADPLVIQALDARLNPSLATEIAQGRPYRTIQDPDRISAFEPLAAELRARDAYRVSSDLFSLRVVATVNGMTKIVHSVVARTGDTGDTALVYFRME